MARQGSAGLATPGFIFTSLLTYQKKKKGHENQLQIHHSKFNHIEDHISLHDGAYMPLLVI